MNLCFQESIRPGPCGDDLDTEFCDNDEEEEDTEFYDNDEEGEDIE